MSCSYEYIVKKEKGIVNGKSVSTQTAHQMAVGQPLIR